MPRFSYDADSDRLCLTCDGCSAEQRVPQHTPLMPALSEFVDAHLDCR